VAGQWFSPGTLVSSTNKTDRHDITEILLKVALKHHNPNPKFIIFYNIIFQADYLPYEAHPILGIIIFCCILLNVSTGTCTCIANYSFI
jgi:hypothetical protein